MPIETSRNYLSNSSRCAWELLHCYVKGNGQKVTPLQQRKMHPDRRTPRTEVYASSGLSGYAGSAPPPFIPAFISRLLSLSGKVSPRGAAALEADGRKGLLSN